MSRPNQLRFSIVLLIVFAEALNCDAIGANPLNLTQHQHEFLTKKSGGRSGGGSFNSRPQGSNSSQRNYTKPKSASQRRNYERRSLTTPTYSREERRPYRRSTTVYSSDQTSRSNDSGGLIFLSFLILTGGVLIYLAYRMHSQADARLGNSETETKINQERDNDLVTVSMLQVALSFPAQNIEYLQRELSELSLSTDTNADIELVKLMQESALVLLRNSHAWTHVLAQSSTLDRAYAESAFDRLSISERSKFSGETLSNVDGIVVTKEAVDLEHDDLGAYVVVTLIVGTADDQPLFGKIDNETSLKEALLQLSSMSDDFLMKFELLWTPQAAPQYLSDDELLLEYSNILPLI